MIAATAVPDRRLELAHRAGGGVEVTLYWSSDDNSTSVELWQHASNELFVFDVPREHALDAFYHPFAHAPSASDHPVNARGGSE